VNGWHVTEYEFATVNMQNIRVGKKMSIMHARMELIIFQPSQN